MSEEKSDNKTEKNKLSNSNVSAGEKVHIGDIYNILNHESGNNKGGKKGGIFFKYIGILSITLVVIGINEYRSANIDDAPNGKVPSTDTTNIIETPVSLEKIEPIKTSKSKAPIKYVNALHLKTTPGKYKGIFTSNVGEMLRSANIKYQMSGQGNVANRIECTFDLQKNKTQSGMRDAFKYSLTLQVEVFDNTGQSCFSGFYASTKPRIGYPEDSEDVLRNKVIAPCLAEIKNAFRQNMPTLCGPQ